LSYKRNIYTISPMRQLTPDDGCRCHYNQHPPPGKNKNLTPSLIYFPQHKKFT